MPADDHQPQVEDISARESVNVLNIPVAINLEQLLVPPRQAENAANPQNPRETLNSENERFNLRRTRRVHSHPNINFNN